jgi:hypothetical protein
VDCRTAGDLIQRELDAATAGDPTIEGRRDPARRDVMTGDDDRFGSPIPLTEAESLALAEHCASCRDCSGLRDVLRSIDAALAADAVDNAPAWFANAVMREIARPVQARRLEPAVVAVASVLGAVAVVTTLIRTGALSGIAGPVSRFASIVDSWLDGIVTATTTSPGVEVVQTFQPGGVVIGFVWALAAAGAAFLAVSAFRLSKELSFGGRRVLSR